MGGLAAIGVAAALLAGLCGLGAFAIAARPVDDSSGGQAAECALVAQIDATRWRALGRANPPDRRPANLIEGVLQGAPTPWEPTAGDGPLTRVRLLASRMRSPGAGRPLDCSATFEAAGLRLDNDAAADATRPGGRVAVSQYSRVRFAPGRAWALAAQRTCFIGPSEIGGDLRVRLVLERRSGRWVQVASGSGGGGAELREACSGPAI